jgi:hypothetical protein
MFAVRTLQEVLSSQLVIPLAVVCPLACDAEAATLAFAEDQRVHPRYTPLLEYFEALAPKWMERMTDLRPS